MKAVVNHVGTPVLVAVITHVMTVSAYVAVVAIHIVMTVLMKLAKSVKNIFARHVKKFVTGAIGWSANLVETMNVPIVEFPCAIRVALSITAY